MRSLVKRLPIFSVLLLLLVAVEGRAQDVMTIKGGGMSHEGNGSLSFFSPHGFYFIGDDLIASASDEKGASAGMSCNPCAPGQTLNLNVTISKFFNSALGRATVGGIAHYPVWFLGSEFKISITPVTIPDADAPQGLKARFTMTGKLMGRPHPFTNYIINRQVEGQGTVRIYLVKSHFPDRPGYMFKSAVYNFETRPARTRKESLQPSRPSPVVLP